MSEAVSCDQNLVGKSASEAYNSDPGTLIAVVDGIYAGFPQKPDAEQVLVGTLPQRSMQRADFITRHLQQRFSLHAGDRVALVGVVAEVIRAFRRAGLQVRAFDLDRSVVGQTLEGCTIEDGRALDLNGSKIALVTAMTLWTGTLSDILASATLAGTQVAIYAQTASSLAPYLIAPPIGCVFSEPFPFYVVCDSGVIKYYTRSQEHPKLC